MKALSIKQPWAWLIVNGYKDIENRTWKTKHRGRFMVHASKGIDKESFDHYLPLIDDLPSPDKIERGMMIGTVDLIDVVESSGSSWFQGPVGFVLKDPEPFPTPYPYKGQLNFFEAKLGVIK